MGAILVGGAALATRGNPPPAAASASPPQLPSTIEFSTPAIVEAGLVSSSDAAIPALTAVTPTAQAAAGPATPAGGGFREGGRAQSSDQGGGREA